MQVRRGGLLRLISNERKENILENLEVTDKKNCLVALLMTDPHVPIGCSSSYKTPLNQSINPIALVETESSYNFPI